MKRILFSAMLSLILSAYSEEFTAGNKSVELKVNDGVIQLFAKGSDKAAATLRPAFKGAVTPKVVERPANGYSILELRNSDTILTFKFHPTLPCVYMALNKNASPVTVEWNAEAVVVPSLLGENAIIPKGSQEHYLPPFAPMYSALLDNGDAILSVIPVKARQDAILSPDLKTITLHQRNIEDYYFVLTSAKGCWSKCVATAEAGLEQTYDDCPKPYSAEWKASIPLEKDFFPSGDGNYSTWFVPTIIESNGKNSMDNPPPRVSLPPDKLPTRSAWSSGMEGSYRYPVEFLDGKFKFFYPRFRSLERYKISTARPIYIYALNGSNVPDVTFPWPFLPAWVSANGQYSTMNFGSSPATCASTASMEKIFYQDQAKERPRRSSASWTPCSSSWSPSAPAPKTPWSGRG